MSDDSDYTLEDWRQEVQQGHTKRGYKDWKKAQEEEARHEAARCSHASPIEHVRARIRHQSGVMERLWEIVSRRKGDEE